LVIIRGISRLLLEIEQWPAELAMGLRGAQFRISIPIENINFSLLNNMLGGREREKDLADMVLRRREKEKRSTSDKVLGARSIIAAAAKATD
jgi:hypothetical protein